jgi:CelD/BcsL family acetyltransferase involved in cellulose biosynthesis
MHCVTIDPLTDPRWQTLVEQSPSDVFHSIRWLRVLARTYGFEPRAIVLLDEPNRVMAGMPFCIIDGLPTRRIAAPPFSDYCDPIVSSISQWDRLLDALLDEGCTITVRCLHNGIPLSGDRMTVVNRAKWHGLDLTPDLDTIWAGLNSSARRAVRKAENHGVVIRAATDLAELRAFFELHLRIRKYKYRLLAQPYAFFQNLWDEFVTEGRGALMIAIHEERLVGGVFFLEWKDTLYYKFNASDVAFVSVRPNDLIIWKAVQAAKANGMTRLDFGLSDWGEEGLVRYKRKYASDEKTITYLQSEGVSAPSAAQTREILPLLTDLLTDEAVPDAITEQAGEVLYRLFA